MVTMPEGLDKKTKQVVYGWLFLAVSSLVFAGIFALLVALARTPLIENLLPLGRGYIYVALVGHVVLAVVVWFLLFEGFLWAFASTLLRGSAIYSPLLGSASLALSGGGMLLVVVSALFGLGTAELANYVPVLLTPVFYAGLILFGAGISLNLINGILALSFGKGAKDRPLPVLTLGMGAAYIAVITAFLCFGLSAYFQLSTGKAHIDFERLFWGGGHILQFANTISMVTVWAYLVYAVYGLEAVPTRYAKVLYGFYLAFIIPAPAIYFMYDAGTPAYKESFTTLMRWGLGPPTGAFVTLIILFIISHGKAKWKRPGFSSLVLSMIIFAVGGGLALMIKGVNTIIPAHYHCVIGAVTIAFMGLFYELLPVFKRRIYSVKTAAIQPYLYFSGILLFAAGLYIAGSHGVARKTYAGAQNLDSAVKLVGMAVMGLGGLVSIAGGIAFVVNALVALCGRVDSGDGIAAGDERFDKLRDYNGIS